MAYCADCQSEKIVKNGRIHNGEGRITNAKFERRQFVENPQHKPISQMTKDKIARQLP